MNRLLAFVIATLVLTPAVSSRAGLMEPLSIETLATNADVVVHGTVVSKTVERDPQGRIFTRVRLAVTEVWKGSALPEDFSIVHSGGRIGNVESRASTQVNYEMGEEIVAMLRLNQRGEGVTLGLVQGKFQVETESAGGQKFVSNPFHGRTENPSAEKSQVGTNLGRLTLGELKQRVIGGQPR